MTELKHTPGPWLVFRPENTGGWGWCIGTTDRLLVRICGARNGTPDVPAAQKQANARLISAAPDLLDACRQLLAVVGYCADNLGYQYGPEVGVANRAIAKAEGK